MTPSERIPKERPPRRWQTTRVLKSVVERDAALPKIKKRAYTFAQLSNAIGAEVRFQRGERGITDQVFCERSGISKSRLGATETGKVSNQTIDTLHRFSIALDMELHELIRYVELRASGI